MHLLTTNTVKPLITKLRVNPQLTKVYLVQYVH